MINNKLKVQIVHLTVILMAFVLGCIKVDQWLNSETVVELHAQEPAQPAPLPSTSIEATPEPVMEESSQYEQIRQEIIEVFGEHADKAFLLLQGEGCAENRALNPNALNDNTAWGGVGKDYGIFQINDYWQGVRHEGKAEQFLFDPSINIRIAWRLYEDDNYSFKLWTCGRYHGI